MPQITSPDQIPFRSIGSRFLSASETNGLIDAARNITRSGFRQIDDYIINHITRFHSILITPEEEIPKYSIFTIQADSVTFDSSIPTAKSLSLSQDYHQLVYVTNQEHDISPNAKHYCRIIGDDEAFLLTYDNPAPSINSSVGPGTPYHISTGGCGLLTVSPVQASTNLVWCIRDYGFYLKVGKLDEELAHDDYATVSIWCWNGAAWVDSGEDIIAYDWLLAAGQTVAIGKKVIIQKHYDGIWIVTEAECP